MYAFTLTYPDGRTFGYTNDRAHAIRLALRFGLVVTTEVFGQVVPVTF